MWRVVVGGEDVAPAQDVFGAICVDGESAEKVLQACGIAFGQERTLPAVAGEIQGSKLYRLDELARLNKLGKCAADRASRAFHVPAPTPAEAPAPVETPAPTEEP